MKALASYFNSRPSARGDATQSTTSRRSVFQFTPLREGRREERGSGDWQNISIHAPPRGATRLAGCVEDRAFYFNSRPSARGDVAKNEVLATGKIFQFTPLREGRRQNDHQGKRPRPISIHAPPRGATGFPHHVRCAGHISIHAPPRGATLRESRKGVARNISIHAPPRGATRTRCASCKRTSFQFTPLREGRRGYGVFLQSRPSFQFTPLREGRPRCSALSEAGLHFNSRPSARGDDTLHGVTKYNSYISIHAPPRGATAKDMQFLQLFCSTLTNQHGLTIVPRNLSRLFW